MQSVNSTVTNSSLWIGGTASFNSRLSRLSRWFLHLVSLFFFLKLACNFTFWIIKTVIYTLRFFYNVYRRNSQTTFVAWWEHSFWLEVGILRINCMAWRVFFPPMNDKKMLNVHKCSLDVTCFIQMQGNICWFSSLFANVCKLLKVLRIIKNYCWQISNFIIFIILF